ncbi:helix-turn-helix domain-containing protein [Streptomyces bacillaris]|uniref:helix-turn-helix domain-containing protein n=1 Tax=Streptomyces bacillaris TaxID=68179 RepID=UPI0035D7F403
MTDELGPVLRRLRHRAGLTQEQLAERSTVSVRTIRRLETGRSADHRLTTVNLLADALGVGAEERRQLVDSWHRAQPAVASGPESPAAEPATAAAPVPLPAPAVAPLPFVSPALAAAAASLAGEVRRRWQREEWHRRVHDPFPLPVRWRPAARELMDHPANIQRLPPGVAPHGLDLEGGPRSVADTYRSIASERLVILGRVGSGKSILAIRFALDLLGAPAPPPRVPVIFGAGSWDPATTTFRDFLIDRLLRDHPHLAHRLPSGSTPAADLVDDGLILPVLDGFDEIAEGLREGALEALSTAGGPLVLTSRREEYAEAVDAAYAPLAGAAAIELTDLTVEDLGAYLPRADRRKARQGDSGSGSGSGGESAWSSVVEKLPAGDAPGSAPLAEALRTPLMVSLARAMYSRAPGRDPAELLDAERFPTTSRLEEHFLAGFVPAVYRHRAPERDEPRRQRACTPDQAMRWLGYLAHTMDGRQDLAWWRIGPALPAVTRALLAVLVSALCMASATWLVQLLALPSGLLEVMDLRSVLLQGLFVGLLTGTAFGLSHSVLAMFGRAAVLPSRVQLRLSAPHHWIGRQQLQAFTSRFGFMMLGGSVLGIGYAWALALLRAMHNGLPLSDAAMIKDTLVNMLIFALIFGLTSGLVFGTLGLFEAPMDIAAAATPSRLLSVNRAVVGRQLLALIPLLTLGIALCGYAVVALLHGLFGPLLWTPQGALLLGTVGGLGGSTAYVLTFTAWGQWLTLCRIWLPLTGRLPWNTAGFLEDAYHRGVLRQAGAVYHFRHNRLQRHLAHAYRRRSPGARNEEPRGR